MQESKSPAPPCLLMTLMVLTGLGIFLWHLAIHPEPHLADPGPLPPIPTRGIAPFVAVAARHDDGAAVGFTAAVHQRDRVNFGFHLDHIAIKQGWYPHRAGEEHSLVVPEADLQLLYEMEHDQIDWVRRHSVDVAPSARSTDPARLVNVTVRIRGQLLSGALRGVAITLWALAIVPGMAFLSRLGCEPVPPDDTTADT